MRKGEANINFVGSKTRRQKITQVKFNNKIEILIKIHQQTSKFCVTPAPFELQFCSRFGPLMSSMIVDFIDLSKLKI